MAVVTVYRYKKWNALHSRYECGRRMGTPDAIRDIIGGVPIEGSATEIDESRLSLTLPGLTELNFRLLDSELSLAGLRRSCRV
jgi:hypothetical protein